MGNHARAFAWACVLGAMLLAGQYQVACAQDEAYLVQPGDTLQISVWKEDGLQQDVLVRPDGGLTFPLAGEIQAADRPVGEIRKEIETRVRKYVPDGIVTVAVKTTGGSLIFVLGKVARPGNFLLTRPLDVLQALSLAGGATPYANVNDIRIFRRDGSQQVSIRFRYADVVRGRAPEQNILLHSGDTVVVP